MFKIATWNVNSIRVRLEQVLGWLAEEAPDVLALQETKTVDGGFPAAAFVEIGYLAAFAGEKTFNGVALLSKLAGLDIATHLPGSADPQRRLLAARYGALCVVNVYVPNGAEVGSDKYRYKLEWLAQLDAYVRRASRRGCRLSCSAISTSPRKTGTYTIRSSWEGQVLVSPAERAAFRRLVEAGLADTFRLFDQEPRSFSWWDYRMLAFRRNHGLRIDHILASPALAARCAGCCIDKAPCRHPKPSDHTPVVAEFAWDPLDGKGGAAPGSSLRDSAVL
jgi:exodeoxyribonuclease III